MIYLSIALFAVAAVGGLFIFKALLQKQATPKPIVYAHGAAAAIALVTLIVYAVQNPANYPKVSIILFVVAALGGSFLFFRDMKGTPGPVGLAAVHALAAVTGFVLLLLFAFGG